jgi:type VI secretion system protein ImpH
MISLFYRAWEKYRFAVGYERSVAEEPRREDLFTHCLYCLVGLGTARLRGRMEFDDEAFLYFAGHFAHYPRSADALEMILTDYFELPVEVDQFQGQWLYLQPDDQSSLPCSRWPQGLNTSLGTEVVIGERVWDVANKFRVRFGPLDYRAFQRFLPAGDALRPLCQMIRCYVGHPLDFDVQPILKGSEVPWCRLGDDADPARLGWNTWIRSRAFDYDVSDAVFSLEGLPWTTSA